MDQELILWALYDLSGARALDSSETMQNYFRRFRELRGQGLTESHMAPCRVLGVLLELDAEKTFAPIIQFARYACRHAKTSEHREALLRPHQRQVSLG